VTPSIEEKARKKKKKGLLMWTQVVTEVAIAAVFQNGRREIYVKEVEFEAIRRTVRGEGETVSRR